MRFSEIVTGSFVRYGHQKWQGQVIGKGRVSGIPMVEVIFEGDGAAELIEPQHLSPFN